MWYTFFTVDIDLASQYQFILLGFLEYKKWRKSAVKNGKFGDLVTQFLSRSSIHSSHCNNQPSFSRELVLVWIFECGKFSDGIWIFRNILRLVWFAVFRKRSRYFFVALFSWLNISVQKPDNYEFDLVSSILKIGSIFYRNFIFKSISLQIPEHLRLGLILKIILKFCRSFIFMCISLQKPEDFKFHLV